MQRANNVFASALERVRKYIGDRGLFEKGEGVLCALSGGADSVALLLFLKELSCELELKVYAAHLNHGIRGQEADRDEEYCRRLCEQLDIPLQIERKNVPEEAKRLGKGLEEAARDIRYGFLESAAKRFNCSKICTAHHADDNIETVLMHLIRGSGLNGLTGISPKRGNIVRPLLTLRKAELVAALTEKGYSFVHDSTNDNDDCTRNYIRHNILPHIYKLNGSADKVFARACVLLEADSEYLEREASRLPDGMRRAELALLHGAILARYIRRRFARVANGASLDAESVAKITDAIINGETVKHSVPCDLLAYISDSGLEFCPRNAVNEAVDIPLEWGENIISPIGYKILITMDDNLVFSFTNVYKSSICKKVKFDKITDGEALSVRLRTRKAGDSYTFGKNKRDVRRQLINCKIPVQKRDRLPVLYTEEGIFLVHGLPLSDAFRPKNGEKTAFIVISEI